jgi:NADPH2:quinone reductase
MRIKESTPGRTMKASRIHSFGDRRKLVYETAPRPRPGDGEILVRVHAAGVNPVDWKTRQGLGVAETLPAFPVVLGWDVSGVVAAAGKGAMRFREGDEVYGMIRFPGMGGAYAQYATAPAGHLASKPASVDHIQAASVPLAALTAWQALFDVADLQPGQRVLIHAAAGGVGHLAVQLAKWKGAYVVGTASRRNLDFVRQLGADETFDYGASPFEDSLRDFDVVLDAVGGDIASRSYPVLRKGGTLVSITHSGDAARAQVKPDGEQLARIADLIDAGRLRPVVETVFPLSEAGLAHELSEKGRTRGKIVLTVEAENSRDVIRG